MTRQEVAMTELPPLYRAAMQVSFENAGIEHPRVQKNGRITEIMPGETKPIALIDPAFIVQAAVEADEIVELLTGQPLSVGKDMLEGLGVIDADVLYEKRREVGHGFTSVDLRDCLTLARTMIGAARQTINRSPRM